MQRPTLLKKLSAGLCSGFLNGLFGSGGGVVAVLFLRDLTKDEKKAHASATLMILVLSIISLAFYGSRTEIPWQQGFALVPGGLAGAVFGTKCLKSMTGAAIRRLFGAVLAVSGVLMLI